MSNLKTWISAFRLRTLPLASAAVLIGASLADLHHSMDLTITALCFTTAVALQILSNLANDYGDFSKGTDSENRVGNMRALQSGNITPAQMRVAIVLFIVCCLLSGVSLLYKAAEGNINVQFITFFIIGLVAIAASIKYTVGKNAYGYSGFGDIAVFIFFGPVAIIGTFLLNTHFEFNFKNDWMIILPASAVGLLSTAVLNTNNIRDIENDKASNKITIPVKIGLTNARIYHAVLIVIALLFFFIYSFTHNFNWVIFFQIPASMFIIKNLLDVWKTLPSVAYNKFLKELSLGILFFVVIYVVTNSAAQTWNTIDGIMKFVK
ncbi:MAG: 1,4-dihydroxy-2-naphthoate octaprenyltransferase [Bacteroidota bacterium]